MPTLPRKVWVHSHEMRLVMVGPKNRVLVKQKADAYTDTEARRIWICKGLGSKRTLELVFHELTHVINFANDVEPTIDKGLKTSELEEYITIAHGRTWAQVFVDNPKFAMWVIHMSDQIRKEQTHA